MSESIPEPFVGPCGCRFDCDVIDGVNTMVLTACAKGEKCEWVQWVMSEAQAQAKTTTVLG